MFHELMSRAMNMGVPARHREPARVGEAGGSIWAD